MMILGRQPLKYYVAKKSTYNNVQDQVLHKWHYFVITWLLFVETLSLRVSYAVRKRPNKGEKAFHGC